MQHILAKRQQPNPKTARWQDRRPESTLSMNNCKSLKSKLETSSKCLDYVRAAAADKIILTVLYMKEMVNTFSG
jgi:hypothetical protein